jgi:hypothetical protein
MIRVWKIWDQDCPICTEMARFDRTEIHGRAGYYRDIRLEDVHNDARLAEYVKSNVMTKDGTVDIPIYIVEWRNVLIGWMQGLKERTQFRKELVEIIAKGKKR